MTSIEIGEYVRTKDGYIAKITEIDHHIWFDSIINKISGISRYSLSEEEFSNLVIKHSKNIIDLIEVSDYVNGKEIHEIDENRKRLYSYEKDDYNIILNRDIQRVVTKEQFSNMEYRV